MSVFSPEKLPSSFVNEVIKSSPNIIVLRSNVRSLEECEKWVQEFSEKQMHHGIPGNQNLMEKDLCAGKSAFY